MADVFVELDRLAGHYRQAEKDYARLMEEDHDSGPVAVRHLDMTKDESNDAAHELAGFVAENAGEIRKAVKNLRDDADAMKRLVALLVAKAGGELTFTPSDILRLGDDWTLETWENHESRGIVLRAAVSSPPSP